jgi:UDP-2,4-diacetamido-2,4,6-trideoxy-beta-L-altropyranose hydrolase
MNITNKIKEANHNLILLDYNIEPELNNYRSWIGKKYEEEIDEFINIIKNNNYDYILIDHYGIDHILEKKIKKYCKKVIVISDIFEYDHYCDIFINYNSDNLAKVKSINLNEDTVYKIGIENIIINKMFITGQKKVLFNDNIKVITINMGGADPQNYILKVLELTNDYIISNDIIVNIIIGKSNSNINSIQKFIEINKNNYNYKIFFDINYDELINLHIESDLAIGSLSITAYERLFLNVPQICIKIVDNQLIQQLEEFNIVSLENLMNKILDLSSKNILNKIKKLNKIIYPQLSIFN